MYKNSGAKYNLHFQIIPKYSTYHTYPIINLTIPDNLESAGGQNGTYWEPVVAGHRPRHPVSDLQREHHKKKPVNEERGKNFRLH